MLKTGILIVILLLCTAYVYSQDSVFFNGNVWEKLTEDGKIIYLFGVIHGEWIVRQALYDIDEKAVLELVDKNVSDKRYMQQIIKIIDTFYEDNPAQKEIPVYVVYYESLKASKRGLVN